MSCFFWQLLSLQPGFRKVGQFPKNWASIPHRFMGWDVSDVLQMAQVGWVGGQVSFTWVLNKERPCVILQNLGFFSSSWDGRILFFITCCRTELLEKVSAASFVFFPRMDNKSFWDVPAFGDVCCTGINDNPFMCRPYQWCLDPWTLKKRAVLPKFLEVGGVRWELIHINTYKCCIFILADKKIDADIVNT